MLTMAACEIDGLVRPDVVLNDCLFIFDPDTADCTFKFTCPKCHERREFFIPSYNRAAFAAMMVREANEAYPHRVIKLPQREPVETRMKLDELIEFGLHPNDDDLFFRITGQHFSLPTPFGPLREISFSR